MTAGSAPDTILQRFPGPVTLHPSRGKWLLIFVVCALFGTIGVGMIVDAAPMGWFVLIVFASGVVIAAVMLVPGAGSLKLDRDGFVVTSLFRRHAWRWNDVSDFVPEAIAPAMRKVMYDDVNAAGRTAAKLSVAIAGRNSGLPDTYGLAAAELAHVMTQWRERALGPAASAGS